MSGKWVTIELHGKDVILQKHVHDYYEFDNNSCGGSLHIVLDDGNYDDGSVQFCLQFALERKDYFGAYLASELLKRTVKKRKEINFDFGALEEE